MRASGDWHPHPMKSRLGRNSSNLRRMKSRLGRNSSNLRRMKSTVGGILDLREKRYKSFVVNIRPPLWENNKIWIGKLGTFEHAQYVADAVYFYIGEPPFHVKNAAVTYPPLQCIGTVIGVPELLSTKEMCYMYVRSIAKGAKFEPQRKDFIQQVKNVIRRPNFPFLDSGEGTAATPQEVFVRIDDNSEREEDAPSMEFDEHSANALQMSSFSSGVFATVVPTHVSHVARSDADLVRGTDYFQGYVPSFEIHPDDTENILHSAGQYLGWVSFSMDDCPTTLSEDEKNLQTWNEALEGLNKSSEVGASSIFAAGTSTPSVASISNAGEVYREWYEL